MLTSIRSLMAASVLAGSVFVAAPAAAESDFTISGNATIVSAYRFRGVDLSDGDIAIQGGADIAHKSGFYVGTWASSQEDGGLGHTELNLYGGWSGEVSDGVVLDAGVLGYLYPNADRDFDGDVNTTIIELYTSLGFNLGPVGTTVGAAWAPKQDALGGRDSLYVYTDAVVGLPNTPVSLNAHVGYTDGAMSPDFRSTFDWSVGADFAISENLTLGAKYVGADANTWSTRDAVIASLGVSF